MIAKAGRALPPEAQRPRGRGVAAGRARRGDRIRRVALSGLFALAAVSSGCGPSAPPESPRAVAPCAPTLDGGDVFADAHVEGTFVLRDDATGCSRATDVALADTPFRPMSTFKIPNTLIGLETGVIAGVHHRFRWDGRERPVATWNADMELPRALEVSCVPCFQQVARDVGEARMKTWVQALRYGNADVSGAIDAFWLTGPLRITPRRQAELVHELLAGALPVRREHVELVWSLLEIERTGDTVWRGKTGLGRQDGRAIGWLVGTTEVAGARWTYATLLRGSSDDEAEVQRLVPLRKALSRRLLVRAGALR